MVTNRDEIRHKTKIKYSIGLRYDHYKMLIGTHAHRVYMYLSNYILFICRNHYLNVFNVETLIFRHSKRLR